MLRRRPTGFTLIELLVVFGILSILTVLAVPAILAARDSARRATCGMNLAKLAIGVGKHDVAKGAMPGWVQTLVVGSGTYQVNFATQLLPYVERNDIYDAWVSSTSAWATYSLPGVTVFQCPAQAAAYSVSYFSGPLDYRANYGCGCDQAYLGGNPSNDDGAFVSGALGRSRSLADIEAGDGLQCTFLLTENMRGALGPYDRSYLDGYCGSCPTYHAYDWCSGFGIHIWYPSTPINAAQASGIGGYIFPWSVHGGGAFVAFADGSVRFEKESMPLYVYAHLVTSRSVWNPSTSTYSNNSGVANNYLKYSPAPLPYAVKDSDYK